MDDRDRQRFLEGEGDAFKGTFDAPIGPVEVHVEAAFVVLSAEWGGWGWEALGSDRTQALRRLKRRLERRDPFYGFDACWGEPGRSTGDLDPRIPEMVRAKMQAWDLREDDVG